MDQDQFRLNYTAINIRNAEKSEGVSFFDAFDNMKDSPSFSDIVFLMRAGGASDDEINEQVRKGIPHCFNLVLDGVKDAGFLGKTINVESAKKQLQAAEKELNTDTSGNSGKAKK